MPLITTHATVLHVILCFSSQYRLKNVFDGATLAGTAAIRTHYIDMASLELKLQRCRAYYHCTQCTVFVPVEYFSAVLFLFVFFRDACINLIPVLL